MEKQYFVSKSPQAVPSKSIAMLCWNTSQWCKQQESAFWRTKTISYFGNNKVLLL